MKRINPHVIELCVEMVRCFYGLKYTTTAKELADLISLDFDCVCLEEDVQKYVVEDLDVLEALEMSELIGIA